MTDPVGNGPEPDPTPEKHQDPTEFGLAPKKVFFYLRQDFTYKIFLKNPFWESLKSIFDALSSN